MMLLPQKENFHEITVAHSFPQKDLDGSQDVPSLTEIVGRLQLFVVRADA